MRCRNVMIVLLIFCLSRDAYAYTTEHHAVNMSRDLANIVAAPIKAIFVEGPEAVKEMYDYEVEEREKPENRNDFWRKVYAIVSAPAVETKAIVDGLVSSVTFTGKFIKEFLSIPFCD